MDSEGFAQFDVQQLINAYFNALDSRDYPALLDWLTDDVDWKWNSSRSGRQDVASALEARPANLEVRHLVTNHHITRSADGFDIFFLVTALAHFKSPEDAVPFPLGPPAVLGEGRAHVVATEHGLRIARLIGTMVMRDPTIP